MEADAPEACEARIRTDCGAVAIDARALSMSGRMTDVEVEVEVGALVPVEHWGCFETKDGRGRRRPNLFARIKNSSCQTRGNGRPPRAVRTISLASPTTSHNLPGVLLPGVGLFGSRQRNSEDESQRADLARRGTGEGSRFSSSWRLFLAV